MSRTDSSALFLVLALSVSGLIQNAGAIEEVVKDQVVTTPSPSINEGVEYVNITGISFNNSKIVITKRPLTPEEQVLADRARAHIAEVVKKNLIRFFTIIAASNNAHSVKQQSRQFGEDDDDGDEDATFNPNTLPQVAQLLGAIFAGNLNLTSIIDRAFYLVPDTVRNQVSGIFSLLTGQPTTTPAPPPPPPPPPTTQQVRTIPPPTVPTTTTLKPDDVVASFVISSPGRNKTKYKIRRKIPSTTTHPIVVGSEEYEIISDDELQRLEKNLIESAKQYEPVVKQAPPQDFMGQLRQIFASTNMTEVIRAVPDIFNGARQAYTLLEDLGALDDLPDLSELFGGDDDDD